MEQSIPQDLTQSQQLTLGNHDLFEHEPLEHAHSCIRLIKIAKDLSSDGLVRCNLHHGTVNDKYICLSYRWGDATPLRLISINEQLFWVRPNLHDFLNIARSHPERTDGMPYWIDALCIQQNNILERNHQVSQMGQIYSKAYAVHIWLGLMPEMAPMFRLLALGKRARLKQKRKQGGFDRKDTPLIRRHLLNNEYWKRAWITQEVMLASLVFVLQDEEMINLAVLIQGLRNIGVEWDRTSFKPFASCAPHNRALKGTPLIELLARFRDKECQIPRDRIFSLLSLSEEGQRITVDYEQTNLDLAYHVLDACNSTLCLCTAAVIAETLHLTNEEHPYLTDPPSWRPPSVFKQVPFIEFDLPALQFSAPGMTSSKLWSFHSIDVVSMKQISLYCRAGRDLVYDWTYDPWTGKPMAASQWDLVPMDGWQIFRMDGQAKGSTVRITLDRLIRFGPPKDSPTILCDRSRYRAHTSPAGKLHSIRVGYMSQER